MRIADFGVEIWMNRWETRCRYNLAETCVDSITVAGLLALAGMTTDDLAAELAPVRLTYGAIEGSDRLRAAIAALYATATPDRVLVTHGAIGANHLVHETLVGRGDIVASVVPTYQQHTAIPEALGAEVRRVALREAEGWRLDLDELSDAARGARLIALTNPNNPTGARLSIAEMDAIIAIADREGAWLLADEVYRGLDQDGPGTSPSFADRYPRAIAVGSMSKAFSLAGLRLGWIAAPHEVLEPVSRHRDYSTISVGMIDDLLAAIALEHADALLARNRGIVRANLATLSGWLAEEPRVSWVRPASGTTAVLRIGAGMASEELCTRLVETEGVMLVPGSAFDLEGTVRIGYANDAAVLTAGLERMSAFLASLPD
ncbi:MAG: aminotransferase class I/II-fold pyridoxal phosphate-dependent enzyme [Chloroflexota bacterium]